MHPAKVKSIVRQEQILLSFKQLDYLTREQLQRIHDLKGVRNANRILQRMDQYLSHFYEGKKIYYLNKRGREIINSHVIRTKLTTVNHYLMRNNLYIHLGMPKTWQNEVKMISGANTSKEIKIVADAHYLNDNKHHIVEIDNLQKMQKNEIKIDKYRRLIERNSFKGMPVMIFVTNSHYRQKVLKELCEGLNAHVFLNTDIGG